MTEMVQEIVLAPDVHRRVCWGRWESSGPEKPSRCNAGGVAAGSRRSQSWGQTGMQTPQQMPACGVILAETQRG